MFRARCNATTLLKSDVHSVPVCLAHKLCASMATDKGEQGYDAARSCRRADRGGWGKSQSDGASPHALREHGYGYREHGYDAARSCGRADRGGAAGGRVRRATAIPPTLCASMATDNASRATTRPVAAVAQTAGELEGVCRVPPRSARAWLRIRASMATDKGEHGYDAARSCGRQTAGELEGVLRFPPRSARAWLRRMASMATDNGEHGYDAARSCGRADRGGAGGRIALPPTLCASMATDKGEHGYG